MEEKQESDNFYPRDAVSAGYCYSNVCLSVRLSHSRTVLKRLKGLVTSNQ